MSLSGEAHHLIATPSLNDAVKGKVFEISAEELAQSDKYEVADYQRILAKMASGTAAWV